MLKYLLLLLSIAAIPTATAQTTTCRNATSYGADPTGATPSNAAFNSAVAATDGVHICVYFPAGLYTFTSTLSVSLPVGNSAASVTIQGDGSETTQLRFNPGVDGVHVTLNNGFHSFHIQKSKPFSW